MTISSHFREVEAFEIMTEIIEEETKEILACGKCGHIYLSPFQLKIHLETDCGKVKNFVCHCGNRYLTEANLNQHKLIHEGQKKFLCDFCGKNFLSKGELKIHERSHTKDKPFGCGICNKRFAYRESLITHSSIHTGVRPYECQCCKKTFSCIGNLLKHRKTKPDTCGSEKYSEVKKIAPRPTTKNLSIPMILENTKVESYRRTKKKRGPYKKRLKLESTETITIEIPPTTLVNIVDESQVLLTSDDKNEQITFIVSNIDDQYQEEIVAVKDEEVMSDIGSSSQDPDNKFVSHVNISTVSYECRHCPKHYKSVKVILRHLSKEHEIDLDMDEEMLKEYTLHKESDTNEAPQEKLIKHMCLKCGRSFSSKTVLTDHERSDCGNKPVYVCDICNKGYHSAGSLKTHKTVHSGELNHVCPYCGQTFRTAGQVKIHSRKHTGEKPYKCQKCEKSFGHRESLLTHESVHTGLKRFMCECGQRFSCISNLKAHRKSHKDTCGKLPLVTKPIVNCLLIGKS